MEQLQVEAKGNKDVGSYCCRRDLNVDATDPC